MVSWSGVGVVPPFCSGISSSKAVLLELLGFLGGFRVGLSSANSSSGSLMSSRLDCLSGSSPKALKKGS